MGVPVQDVINPDSADAQQPQNHNRCKQEPDPVGAVMLKVKQEHQYCTSSGNFNICRTKKL